MYYSDDKLISSDNENVDLNQLHPTLALQVFRLFHGNHVRSLLLNDLFDAKGNIIIRACHVQAQGYAISDSGADSCILGNQATVISYTGNMAQIIGYDSSAAPLTLIPIVSAYIKVIDNFGNVIIWLIHQAPYLETSTTNLLSEYQLCAIGTIVDSCYDEHEAQLGIMGTQSITLFGDDGHKAVVPLHNISATIATQIYQLEPGDEKHYPIHTLTKNEE